MCGSNWFRDDGGPSNVSSVVKLRLFRNETILLSLTNAEDSASIEFDLWKDVVSLAGPQARLLPLYFARQSCFRDDGRRMEVRSCLAVGNSKMYYVFRVGEKGECGHVVASADDDRIAVLDWFPRSGWTEILSQSKNEVSYRNVVYPWADADALSVYRRPLTQAVNDSKVGFEVKAKDFGMRLDLDLGKVFKAAMLQYVENSRDAGSHEKLLKDIREIVHEELQQLRFCEEGSFSQPASKTADEEVVSPLDFLDQLEEIATL